MSLSDSTKPGELAVLDDPRTMLAFFEHAPSAFQIYRADGRSVLVNRAFRELFGSAPPPEYNVLEDDIAKRNGLLGHIHRAFAGETVHVPTQWYDPRELRTLDVKEGRRVAVEVTMIPLRDAGGVVRYVANCCKDVTAEQTLALERAEIAATLQSIGDAVIATDDLGNVVRMNPVAERLTGWSLGEAIGRPLVDVFRIFDDETREPVESPVDRVLREGTIVGLAKHTVLVSKDGTELPIADSGAPIRGADGVVRGVVLVFHDKTEDAKTERALRESESRLRVLNDLTEATRSVAEPEHVMPVALGVLGRHLRASRVAFADVDPDGDRFNIPHDYTDGCASIVGRYDLSLFGPSAVSKLRVGETLVICDVDAELSPDEGAAMFNSIEIKAIVCCSLVRDGVFRAMMAVHQTTPRAWTANEVGIIQEVVERCWATIEHRAAEAKLRRSEALIRLAGRTARLGGWSLAVPELRVTWSDEVCAIHGVPAGTIPTLDQTFASYAPEYREIIASKVKECVGGGTPFDIELQLITSAARRIWVRAIGHAERDAAGAIVRVQGALQEITETKQTEAHLLVSDRMAAMGTLAAGVAHEINNPLASVIANLALADDEIEALAKSHRISGELRDELRDARDGAERVRLIVRDLRIFSHTEEESHGPVDVERVLESMMRLASNELRHRGRLVKVYGSVPPVEANEARLGQVFLNLLVNAAQAIPEGNYEANEVRVETSLASSNRVVVTIADTGTGIPPEIQRRLFTPFLTTKPIGVGTGLGLSICHRILTQMGGEVVFSSEVDKGTVFRVTLPVSQSPSAQLPIAKTTPDTVGPRARVLVIDDEIAIVQAVRRILGTRHEVVTMLGAREALTILREGERFDVVLCDLMMPQITGMDFHAELSLIDKEQANKVVFMTGGAFTANARAFLLGVPNQQIDKPFDIRKLRRLVEAMLPGVPR